MVSEQPASVNYSPLESASTIRIVVLGPGSGTKPIECILLHTDRDLWGAQPYESLSYEWGLPSEDDPFIQVDGRPVQVRKNLWNALMHIRSEEEVRYLWVDALSINQADTKERNHQVNMMRDIYQQAERVIVWIGPAKDGSDSVMTLFTNPTTLDRCIRDRDTSRLESILALCERSYWRRAWVQQEMYLASYFIVHCGTRSIHSEQIDDSLAIIAGSSKLEIPLCRDIEASLLNKIIVRHRIRAVNPLRFWLLFSIHTKLECSEPRDFIYAMLGMSKDVKEGELMPDYGKPLLEVYLETMAICRYDVSDLDNPSCALRKVAARLGISFDEEVKQRILESVVPESFSSSCGRISLPGRKS